MHTNIFFNGSWAGQLLVGCGLFCCSFLIEYHILYNFISPAPLALFLAITLEGGKVAAVIWHYYLGYLTSESYPISVRLVSLIFRLGLFTLSLLCSMLFLTARLDRPHLEQARQERIRTITTEAGIEARQIKNRFADKRQYMLARQRQELASINKSFAGQIQRLEELLRDEMDNVVNGVFKGPRYREISFRLEREKESLNRELAAARQRHAGALNHLDQQLDTELLNLTGRMRDLKNKAATADYADSDQANDPRIVALLNTIDAIFHRRWQPLQFVFYFSILISLLMEAGIMLAFATITMAIAPVLHARHVQELEKEATRVRMEGEVEQETIRHRTAMNRMRQTGAHIIKEAESVAAQVSPDCDGRPAACP